ncbi:glycosyltransferase [Lutibacter sp. B1]|uniref:glycosyltransferase n=1 Tax=Lutibacter sp. B1 TaxID=2725996 RepID=UPI001456B239|nr:glycosyltransferase [Lutibacter sp. B1]NLP58165.1 glycosyltransferase [Lutibacter sp. B1]
MKDRTLISIIIPCYNDAQFIEQSVNSALNQTYPHKEVIVVDDGSNRETKSVLKYLEPKITKLITQENKGQSTARNVGIKEAKGEYILVLDSDDFFEPTFCEKAIAVFFNDIEVKIVSCFGNLVFKNGKKVLYKPKGGYLQDFLINNMVFGSVMFKKNDWNSVLGYDESMKKGFEDWEFYIRLLKNEGKALVLREPLFNYRKRINSTTAKANDYKYKLLEYIYLKHKDLYIANFESTVINLLNIAKLNRQNEIKRLNSINYKAGNFLLKPIRYFKKMFS